MLVELSHPRLLAAQLDEMAARDRYSTRVGIPAVLTVVWMHLGHLPDRQVFGWMICMFVIMALRVLISAHDKASAFEAGQWPPVLTWRLFVSALYGLGWGGSMLLLNTGSLDVLTAFKVGTLTAALGIMLNSMSVIFAVYLAFLVPCWLSLMFYICFDSGFLTLQESIICGVAATIFGFVLVGSSLSIARLTRQFFLSNFERDQALAETRASHQREQALSRQLADQARRDALTGVFNRRYLLEQLDYQASACQRNGQPFSIVLVDIDHFKRVNDTHGHNAGDLVLKGVTQVMSKALREIDVFGRWGGEEFLCILPQADGADAMACAERLRQALHATRFGEPVADLPVTASFGVASHGQGDVAADTVKRADLALYRAKSAGRDCVVADVPA